MSQQLHIVGAGWAGLAAALAADQAGWQVTLHEASAQAGGRARGLDLPKLPDQLDNGQHLLIGAYRATLQLFKLAEQDPDQVLLRTPLDLRWPQGEGFKMRGSQPSLGMLLGVLQARGWRWRDRWSFVKAALAWQRKHFTCDAHWHVQDLCQHHSITDTVMQQLIEPLCLSALNTPTHLASAQVFLRVLQDAFLGGTGACDLLIPRTHLSALLVDACLQKLQRKQHTIQLKHRVSREDIQHWLQTPNTHVLLACPAWEAANLCESLAPDWSAQAHALQHRAIATVYLRCLDPTFKALDRPMMALPYSPEQPAQFVFDHGQLTQQPGLLAAVVSDCTLDSEALSACVLAQLQTQLGLAPLQHVKTLVEKRATFACLPNMRRPSAPILPKLWACGDYVQGPYPATLEGAVRSGFEAIDALQRCI